MKKQLRLALPRLATLCAESELDFAVLDRRLVSQVSGRESLRALAGRAVSCDVRVILHPDDAVLVQITLPPVPSARMRAAIIASIEPMLLGEPDGVCIAYGPRSSHGQVDVAWADRKALKHAWQTLTEAGLSPHGFYPCQCLLSGSNQVSSPLSLPADERWRSPLPRWSLLDTAWGATTSSHRWSKTLYWSGAAAALWLAAVIVYAGQLRSQMNDLERYIHQTVAQTFPSIPVLLDPVLQAQQQLELLRQQKGLAAIDDFMPLAQQAAQVLQFAQGHVLALAYEQGHLSLELAQGYSPPANEDALLRAAAAQGLIVKKDPQTTRLWRVQRAQTASASAGKP